MNRHLPSLSKYISIVTVATVLALVSCSPQKASTAIETEEEKSQTAEAQNPQTNAQITPSLGQVVTSKRVGIDWEKARADMTERRKTSDDASFVAQSAGKPPAVPVLLPDIPFTVASDTGAPAMQFKQIPDGYFAIIPGKTYDMIVNGTDRILTEPKAESGPAASQSTDMDPRFEQTMTGAQVAFNRYGASYLVEFVCKDPALAEAEGCITEDKAIAAVKDLLIAGSQ